MTNSERAYNYLKECGTFFYCTVDNGMPRVRPFGFLMMYEGKIYFGGGKHKEFFKQTMANPNFEICAVAPDKKWIRIKGTAVLDDRPEVMDAVFATSPYLRNLYNEENGRVIGNFYMKDAHVEIADIFTYFEQYDF